jgi:hypothetical protein
MSSCSLPVDAAAAVLELVGIDIGIQRYLLCRAQTYWDYCGKYVLLVASFAYVYVLALIPTGNA